MAVPASRAASTTGAETKSWRRKIKGSSLLFHFLQNVVANVDNNYYVLFYVGIPIFLYVNKSEISGDSGPCCKCTGHIKGRNLQRKELGKSPKV